jgi:hypothetical protein
MDSESEGAYVRVVMESLPNGYLPNQADGRPQKGEGLRVIQYNGVWYPLRRRPGVKHRPKVTQNGHSERGNPSVALRQRRSREPPASADGRDGPRLVLSKAEGSQCPE